MPANNNGQCKISAVSVVQHPVDAIADQHLQLTWTHECLHLEPMEPSNFMEEKQRKCEMGSIVEWSQSEVRGTSRFTSE